MKKMILIVSMMITAIVSAQQTNRYFNEMKNIKNQLDRAKTMEEYVDINNRLIRVEKVFPEQWEPLYYQAYVDLFQYFINPKKENVMLNKVQDKLQDALEKPQADKSDIWALLGYSNMMKINADLMGEGRELMGVTYEILQKSIQENSKNAKPRIVLLIMDLGRKLFFKESVSKECSQLDEIEDLLNSELKRETDIQWEKPLYNRIIKICTNNK